MTDTDILSPIARKALDAMGGVRTICEWHPDKSRGSRIVVVFDDETAAEITVREIPDPGPIHQEDGERSACQNCDWVGPNEQLGRQIEDVPHLLERVSPGEPMPTGECPVCGALCQPVADYPAIYELDDRGEANGVIHFFCSSACRAQSRTVGAHETVDAKDLIDETRCETCGRELDSTFTAQ